MSGTIRFTFGTIGFLLFLTELRSSAAMTFIDLGAWLPTTANDNDTPVEWTHFLNWVTCVLYKIHAIYVENTDEEEYNVIYAAIAIIIIMSLLFWLETILARISFLPFTSDNSVDIPYYHNPGAALELRTPKETQSLTDVAVIPRSAVFLQCSASDGCLDQLYTSDVTVGRYMNEGSVWEFDYSYRRDEQSPTPPIPISSLPAQEESSSSTDVDRETVTELTFFLRKSNSESCLPQDSYQRKADKDDKIRASSIIGSVSDSGVALISYRRGIQSPTPPSPIPISALPLQGKSSSSTEIEVEIELPFLQKFDSESRLPQDSYQRKADKNNKMRASYTTGSVSDSGVALSSYRRGIQSTTPPSSIPISALPLQGKSSSSTEIAVETELPFLQTFDSESRLPQASYQRKADKNNKMRASYTTGSVSDSGVALSSYRRGIQRCNIALIVPEAVTPAVSKTYLPEYEAVFSMMWNYASTFLANNYVIE